MTTPSIFKNIIFNQPVNVQEILLRLDDLPHLIYLKNNQSPVIAFLPNQFECVKNGICQTYQRKQIDQYEQIESNLSFNQSEDIQVNSDGFQGGLMGFISYDFAIAQPHLIAALEAVKNSFNSYPMDRFAIAAAVASFEDQTYFEQQCEKVIRSREKLVNELQEIGFVVLPSKANFIFASLPNKDAGELAAELRACGIIVRYFNKPRINQFLRITIGTDEQNQRLVETLKQDILA